MLLLRKQWLYTGVQITRAERKLLKTVYNLNILSPEFHFTDSPRSIFYTDYSRIEL